MLGYKLSLRLCVNVRALIDKLKIIKPFLFKILVIAIQSLVQPMVHLFVGTEFPIRRCVIA